MDPYTATYLLSHTSSKQDDQDMRDTAGDASKDNLINDVLLWTSTRPLTSRRTHHLPLN